MDRIHILKSTSLFHDNLEVDQYGNKVSHYRQTIDPSGRILNTKLTGTQ